MRATIVNDGRKIGLILLDELDLGGPQEPRPRGFTNAVDPVCDLTKSALTPPSILDCTAQTLVTGGSGAYLWADDRHLSASAQNSFASLGDHARPEQPVLSRAALRGAAMRAGRRQRGSLGASGASAGASLAAHSASASSAGRAAFAFGWLTMRDDGVAPARIGEHVAGDADDVAQRAGLQVGAAGSALRAAQRAVDAGDGQRAHQLGHHRARPRRLQQPAEHAGA